MPMHRPVRIYATNGEIKKFECPNPKCNEILTINPQDLPASMVKSEKILCSCGDTTRLKIINRGTSR